MAHDHISIFYQTEFVPDAFKIVCKTCQYWKYWLASGRMLIVLNISLHKTILTFTIIVMIICGSRILLKHDIFSQENIFVTLGNEH